MPDPTLEEAQKQIGYVFRQSALLDEALTHKSYVNEKKEKGRKHNERLEFLGDAVLTFIISEYLLAACPDSTEGDLSKLKSGLVSEAALAKAARRLGLGKLLRLGRGEELTQGREKPSLLANAFEALVAAVYFDRGLPSAREFVLDALAPDLQEARIAGASAGAVDYKTRLQEWCQKRYETLPQYATVRESGPDHQKTFEVQLMIRGDVRGLGIGKSKKEAEQMAAKQALAQVVQDGP
jgi:ribonuclease-3